MTQDGLFGSSSIGVERARGSRRFASGVGYLIIPRVKTYKGILFDDAGNLGQGLQEDPEWVPVFADAIALVSVRKTPEQREVIAKHGIPKEQLFSWGLMRNYDRGNLLAGSGRREEAAVAFRAAIRDEPGNDDAWHNLGCVLGELSRMDEAAAAFEETLRLKPDHPTARKNLRLIPGHGGRSCLVSKVMFITSLSGKPPFSPFVKGGEGVCTDKCVKYTPPMVS